MYMPSPCLLYTSSPHRPSFEEKQWIQNIEQMYAQSLVTIFDECIICLLYTSECKYCHYIHDFKEDLDKFFGNFFSRQEEYIQTLEAIDSNNINDVVYNVIFKQVLSHFRASLIESETLKKNITVQNYLRLYDRDDLAKQLNDLLLIEIMPTLSLKSMIKESVDKYIAHYLSLIHI